MFRTPLWWGLTEEAVVLFLRLPLLPQRRFPLPLQSRGHQPVLGIDRPVAPLGALGLVLLPTDGLLPIPLQPLPFPAGIVSGGGTAALMA